MKHRLLMLRMRLIIFLIRTILGVKLYEGFRFESQRGDNSDIYFFGRYGLFKFVLNGETKCYEYVGSGVSLMYLLSPRCQVTRFPIKYSYIDGRRYDIDELLLDPRIAKI